MKKPSYEEMEIKFRDLKKKSSEYRLSRKELREQNINLIRKSIELSDIKREFEDKNYELEVAKTELRKQNVNLVKKSIELSDVMRKLEDKNFDFQLSRKSFEDTLNSLQESEERLRILFEYAPDAYYLTDLKGTFIDGNRATEKLTGYSRNEFIGKTFKSLNLLPPKQMSKAIKLLKKNVLKKPTGPDEFSIISKNGTLIYAEISTYPVKTKGNILVLGIARDITRRKNEEEERRKLEEQFFQAQKMESIGRLAGSIAHDFNNILVSIMGNAEMLKMRYTDPESPEKRASSVIVRGTRRAAELTQQLLSFARGGKFNPVPLKIDFIIKETVEMSEKIFEKNIKVKFAFSRYIDTVEADMNQLEQVFLNLIVNAKDAMPGGGKLLFKTENICLDTKHKKRYPGMNKGNYVKVTVSDNGIGMNKEIRDNIFEPFFSTKGEGKGTGLGLSTVYGIVKNHNAYIYVNSEKGKGTDFIIFFPTTDKDIIDKKEDDDLVQGAATILVIDDEEEVRYLLNTQLADLGYKILFADDGRKGIKLYKSKAEEIDLVLLDMIMPNLSGKETFEMLKEIDPDIKILIISGYSKNDVVSEVIQRGALGFIQKPFTFFDLSMQVSNALNELNDS